MNRIPVEDIARRVLDALPRGIGEADEDLRRNLRAGLQAVLARMDLVTREDFDVQARVLARTREKIEALERRVQALEQRVGDG